MRRHQADETDGATYRGRRAHGQGGGDEGQQPQPLQPYT